MPIRNFDDTAALFAWVTERRKNDPDFDFIGMWTHSTPGLVTLEYEGRMPPDEAGDEVAAEVPPPPRRPRGNDHWPPGTERFKDFDDRLN